MCKIELFEQELRLSKSEQTITAYKKQFELFLEYFEGKDLRYLSLNAIKEYILFLHNIYGYSSIIHAISAVKFYYANLNGRKRHLDITHPKKPKTIPTVLSYDEVMKMINLTMNLKHRAIIETIFFHGLRRSELLSLKIDHIDSPNMILKVIQSKGCKDRNIPLSKDCLNTLRLYFNAYRPKKYLFNGIEKENKYSPTSLANIITEAAKRAKINKNVTPHTLRHSFASYLVSININLKKIQEWMGHASIKTTEIYCHIVYEENPIKKRA
jgi:site-specific recombinase XerD